MPDAPNTDAPAVPADNSAPVDSGTTPPADAPKWDGAFDPDRAARLIANVREGAKGYKSALTEVQAKLAEFEQAQLSDAEKLAQRASTAETELSKARRELAVRDALTDHGLSKDAARFLTGETAEEIADSAKAFAALAGVKPAETSPLPPTLPIPGNGADPAAVSQISREQAASMSHDDLLAAYRAGRLRDIGGK